MMKNKISRLKTVLTGSAVIGLCLAIAVLSGCASTSDAGKPVTYMTGDLGMPAPGKSKVVFLRPAHLGWAVHFAIHDGETLIGKSSSASYFAYECEPGQHLFSTSMDNISFFHANLLPDRIYYVHVKVVMGLWVAGVEMHPLYPGDKDLEWKKLPKILKGIEEEHITSADVDKDKVKIQSYMERLKAHQKSPDEPFRAENVLAEYGQPTPLPNP